MTIGPVDLTTKACYEAGICEATAISPSVSAPSRVRIRTGQGGGSGAPRGRQPEYHFTHDEDVAQRLVATLGRLDVHGLLALRSGSDGAVLEARANVALRDWVLHHARLPHAPALVTHSLRRDQTFNATRVEAVGPGRVLERNTSIPEFDGFNPWLKR
jgi:hypothetical protein